MTNENDSNSPATAPQDQPTQQPPEIPPAPLQGALPDNGKRKADDTKNEADELAREFRAAEKWVIGTNITLAVIGIFALCIYYGQLKVMRGQLGEIVKQFPELQKSANAAKSAAETARDTLVSAATNFHTEQRPYLTIENVRFDPPLEQSHSPALVKFDIHNAGRTPALKATFTLNGFINEDKITNIPRDFFAEMTIGSERSVVSSINIWVKPDSFEDITKGTHRLSLKGTIIYADVFKEWHTTTFCAVYDAKVMKLWVFCPGNDVK